jgi:MFS family permease
MTTENGAANSGDIRHPPEIGLLAVAHSFKSFSSIEDNDIVPLSRLHSNNHDFTIHDDAEKEKEKSRNVFIKFIRWWGSWAIPGMGMFSEAYIIFAIGNIAPLLAIDYPNCFGKEEPPDCNKTAAENDTNIEICGIIAGMLVLGYLADWIGRKWGSRTTMAIMLVGGILLSSASGSSSAFLTIFLMGLFIFGFGVGGEYPMASSSAAERAEADPELRKRRGEVVVLTFTQQGWGNFANTLVIIILMAILGATGTEISSNDAGLTWRLQFVIGTVIVAAVSIYRFKYLEESKVWEAERKTADHELQVEGEADHKSKLYSVIFKRYWSRLLVTCGAWVLNDLAFYGNKLFQSTFIEVISPGASLFVRYQWTLLNAGVSLCGYFAAAYLIDKSYYGRKRMMTIGFIMMLVLFLPCGLAYDTLIANYIGLFQFLYFFSSFWQQNGPNCVTFLVAGEVFPTDVRAFFHGISAAFGKAGAIMATQIFSRLSTQNTFYVSAGAGALGALLTVLFLPDTTGLDLVELDRFNMYLLAGQARNYHGEAVNPKFLSWFERWQGYGKQYDPVADREQAKLQALAENKEKEMVVMDAIAEETSGEKSL